MEVMMVKNKNQQTILITGATGQQGGAVAHHLVGKGYSLRALTRKPQSERARELSKMGIEVVQGDLDSPSSLENVLEGVWGVFSVQNAMEQGPEHEEEQGKRLATLAHTKGVQHFVYTSVASAERKTGIPHFESKWRIEEVIRSLKFPSHVIIRPVFFMENLVAPWCLNENQISIPLNGDKPLQMIALDDIGRYGAIAFERCDELNREEIEIAGDTTTLRQATTLLSERLGRRIEFQRVPIDVVRKQNPDFAKMFEWFDKTGYSVDIPALENRFGLKSTTLAQWAKKAKVMV
jgi:uncharacterized protein YbjT (DUF2867 family)